MNIILCIADTLRYDHIGFHGNDSIETPNLDRLASESMVFDNAYTASYPTIPHRTDVITGRYGSPFHIWQPLPFHWPTLPRYLSDQGYCTQLIHDTPHLVNGGHNFDYPFHAWYTVRGAEVDRPWIDNRAGLPENFRMDPACDSLNPSFPTNMYRQYIRANRKRKRLEDWNCARLFSKVAEFLHDNRGRNNFFLWIDSFDPHEPWDSPPEFILKYDSTPGYDGSIDLRLLGLRVTEGVSETLVNRYRAFYAAKVSWLDYNVGKMLEALEQTGLDKNTAIIFTADHGTQLAERGRFGKKSPVKEQEGHVPLLIKVPDGPAGRCDAIAQPQDIFATILGLSGTRIPANFDCHDLLAQADNRYGKRSIAIANNAASFTDKIPYHYTIFDGTYYLHSGLKPEDSKLTAMGSVEDIASENAKLVSELHAAGIDEVERRGASLELMAWLRSGGEKPLPPGCCLYAGCQKPKGYQQYWGRSYRGE